MKHGLLTIASMLSLLLCIVLLAMRIRSGLTHDYISWANGGTYVAASSGGDVLNVHEYGRWPIDQSLTWQHGAGILGPTLIGAPSPNSVTVDTDFHPITTRYPVSPRGRIFFWRLKHSRDVLSLNYSN